MRAKLIVAAVLVLIIAVAGWFFVLPLFVDQTVDEPLPVQARVPTRAEIDAMTETERSTLMSELMAGSSSAPDHVMKEPMGSSAVTELLAMGDFRDADAIHKGSGRAFLYALPDGSHLIRFEQFRVTNGPALVVLLANSDNPRNADDVLAGYRELGTLKGNVGNQNYTVPPDIDITDYGSVVIWCKLFDVLFSPASLERL